MRRYIAIVSGCFLLLFVFQTTVVACCDPPCSGCETCDNGQCVDDDSKCATCEVCSGGDCFNAPVGRRCGDCKECDGAGNCEYTCEGCESCVEGSYGIYVCEDDDNNCEGDCNYCDGGNCYDNCADKICCTDDPPGTYCADPKYCQECDGGFIKTCGGDPCMLCCDGTCYDPQTQGCCDGKTVYNPLTDKCCNEGTGHTCQVDQCCVDGVCINDGEDCSLGYMCYEGECVAVCDGPYELDTVWKFYVETEDCPYWECDGLVTKRKEDNCGNEWSLKCAQSDGSAGEFACAWRFYYNDTLVSSCVWGYGTNIYFYKFKSYDNGLRELYRLKHSCLDASCSAGCSGYCCCKITYYHCSSGGTNSCWRKVENPIEHPFTCTEGLLCPGH